MRKPRWRSDWTWLVTIMLVANASAGEVVENSIGLKLARVPAGEFLMGSQETEKGRRADEPQRSVRLTRDFFIGQFEVTRGQFRRFVEAANYKTDAERGLRGGYGFDDETGKLSGPDKKYSWRFTGFEQTDEHPVVNVSWNDAVAFCRWLSVQEKLTYRLPTEAEWEYACRGGSATAYCNGNDAEKIAEVGNIVDALAKEKFPDRTAIAARDGFVFTAPVGSFKPNAFGLHDMHGNVWEWTADEYRKAYSRNTLPDSSARVLRGGSWNLLADYCRSAIRDHNLPASSDGNVGFRVARALPENLES